MKVVDVKAATSVTSKSGKKLEMQERTDSDATGVCRLVHKSTHSCCTQCHSPITCYGRMTLIS